MTWGRFAPQMATAFAPHFARCIEALLAWELICFIFDGTLSEYIGLVSLFCEPLVATHILVIIIQFVLRNMILLPSPVVHKTCCGCT